MDQLWFIASGVASGAGLRTGRCCFPHTAKIPVSAGSKSGERAYGSGRCPACEGPEKPLYPYRG